MQTSCYARAGNHPNAVAISQGIPKWYKGKVYKKLAPTWEMVRLNNTELFKVRYFGEIVSKLTAQQVFDELGADAILLCWEAPGKSCHRRMVAEWLEQELGINVPEMI